MTKWVFRAYAVIGVVGGVVGLASGQAFLPSLICFGCGVAWVALSVLLWLPSRDCNAHTHRLPASRPDCGIALSEGQIESEDCTSPNAEAYRIVQVVQRRDIEAWRARQGSSR